MKIIVGETEDTDWEQSRDHLRAISHLGVHLQMTCHEVKCKTEKVLRITRYSWGKVSHFGFQ